MPTLPSENEQVVSIAYINRNDALNVPFVKSSCRMYTCVHACYMNACFCVLSTRLIACCSVWCLIITGILHAFNSVFR